jgi:ABC-type transport system substrate-binding protein
MAANTNMAHAADGYQRLVVCLPDGVDSLDPTNHRSRITQIVLKHLFDSLAACNSANEVIPQLAQLWRLIHMVQIAPLKRLVFKVVPSSTGMIELHDIYVEKEK